MYRDELAVYLVQRRSADDYSPVEQPDGVQQLYGVLAALRRIVLLVEYQRPLVAERDRTDRLVFGPVYLRGHVRRVIDIVGL